MSGTAVWKLKAELNYDPITNKVGEGYRIGGERK